MTVPGLSDTALPDAPNSFDWAHFRLRAVISLAIVAIFILVNYRVIEIITGLAEQDGLLITAKST